MELVIKSDLHLVIAELIDLSMSIAILLAHILVLTLDNQI